MCPTHASAKPNKLAGGPSTCPCAAGRTANIRALPLGFCWLREVPWDHSQFRARPRGQRMAGRVPSALVLSCLWLKLPSWDLESSTRCVSALPRRKLPRFLLSCADGSTGTRLEPQNAPRAAARCFGSASSTLSVLDPAPSACTGHDREHGRVPEALKKRERGRGCCKPGHICQPPPPRHPAVGRLCTNPAQPVGKAFHLARVPSDFWRLASRL